VGVEMEADKPGWCDSLNGLPLLFGSSLCETLEIKRAVKLILTAIDSVKANCRINIPWELYDFLVGIKSLLRVYFLKASGKRDYIWWNKSNILKERFRSDVFWGLSGKEKSLTLKELRKIAVSLLKRLDPCVKKARDKQSGLCYTYFFYKIDKYRRVDGGIVPVAAKRKNLPLFLESIVHLLRTEENNTLPAQVRQSSLYDEKLKMYRLNASLEGLPLEIGRSRVFPSGWLENESIWLHMEYKYLLELLKRGFYKDFYRDFFNCAVCFLQPSRYGRNILENSSFIVSSVYPDKSLWGRGFVARLTGATVEMLNIWMVMCLGNEPFFVNEAGLPCIKFSPLIKGSLFTEKTTFFTLAGRRISLPPGSFAFRMFSSILVVYHNPKRRDTFNLKTKKIVVKANGKIHTLKSKFIAPPLSYAVRENKVERIDVYF